MSKKHIFWLKNALFLAFLVIFDQITKYLAKAHLRGKKSTVLIPKVLSFKFLDGGNSGAAWGILSGRIVLFIIFTVFAIILIAKFIYNIYNMYKINYSLNPTVVFINYAMVMLVAGAIGNLIDRIVYGNVTDFISFDFIQFPIFNVADIYVTVSCISLILICIFKVDGEIFNKIFAFKSK